MPTKNPKPKKILGAFRYDKEQDRIYLRLDYGKEGIKIMDLETVKKDFPQLLIKYYESCVAFTSETAPVIDTDQVIDLSDGIEESPGVAKESNGEVNKDMSQMDVETFLEV